MDSRVSEIRYTIDLEGLSGEVFENISLGKFFTEYYLNPAKQLRSIIRQQLLIRDFEYKSSLAKIETKGAFRSKLEDRLKSSGEDTENINHLM
ncbi:hypothetical protein [uncultured Candidatus Kuenenia sp.]|uniref:hypothetical protein n=1 Tax=uncultured Candidatus Kuenenia sp. TaxID=1048336 RepID=UPI000303BE4C|nr:hypothetical protein [uncultured Candidatus Kuenenia sp.]MCF6151838.1 hypothetical protein [Candidatus Kuenenia stuttgartiensis]GJQ50566.1 MAG: hypothetical protein HKUEN01_29520 [Candidatus Kuenenia stuttgartiensis]